MPKRESILWLAIMALLLAGCEPEWERDQHQRCWAMNGTGSYNRVTLTFTCWKRTEPPSHSKKLYESKYK